MKIAAIIPARYASTRLPGKPLLDICGKSLIRRVWEAVKQVKGLDAVTVATDDERIAAAVRAFGGDVCLTSALCRSGSDRVREAAEHLPADIYVNVQGDEPLLEPESIETLIAAFACGDDVQVATLCSRISAEEARSPHQVKVVRAHNGDALYFSRSLLPFVRDAKETTWFGHIGIYAFRAAALQAFSSLPPSPLEEAEQLEQLRFLQAGIPIRVLEVPPMGPGVDTVEDLERVRTVIGNRRQQYAMNRLKDIRLVITDVDGVLTDGSLYYGSDGESLKRFHAHDGLGILLLQQAGLRLAVLSGRDCPALRRRLADLGITECVLGQMDKRAALRGIMERCGVCAEETAYLGDDIPDAEVFDLCGVSATVQDAPAYVKSRAHIVLQTRGGHGAFRELADALLLAREHADKN
ncbi:MAG: 3-deoxy-manno-octulosonate cytidylyltransferase [Desulfovibrio sp.]|nr:3-deoxy-manno-octulosonate cytidylyltransferase [Desulfovibrio sp.]